MNSVFMLRNCDSITWKNNSSFQSSSEETEIFQIPVDSFLVRKTIYCNDQKRGLRGYCYQTLAHK